MRERERERERIVNTQPPSLALKLSKVTVITYFTASLSLLLFFIAFCRYLRASFMFGEGGVTLTPTLQAEKHLIIETCQTPFSLPPSRLTLIYYLPIGCDVTKSLDADWLPLSTFLTMIIGYKEFN